MHVILQFIFPIISELNVYDRIVFTICMLDTTPAHGVPASVTVALFTNCEVSIRHKHKAFAKIDTSAHHQLDQNWIVHWNEFAIFLVEIVYQHIAPMHDAACYIERGCDLGFKLIEPNAIVPIMPAIFYVIVNRPDLADNVFLIRLDADDIVPMFVDGHSPAAVFSRLDIDRESILERLCFLNIGKRHQPPVDYCETFFDQTALTIPLDPDMFGGIVCHLGNQSIDFLLIGIAECI
jgi:hypothetical protein